MHVAISQGAAGTQHLMAGVAGQKIRVRSMAYTISATGTVQLKDTAGNALTGAMNLQTGFILPDNPEGWCSTATGTGFDLVSVTGAANGCCSAYYVPG